MFLVSMVMALSLFLQALPPQEMAAANERQRLEADKQDMNPQYFPRSLNSFERVWYRPQLVALEEPSLYEQRASGVQYRFDWIPSFHHSISARLEIHPDGTGFLTLKSTSGAGGYAPGKLIKREEAAVTAEQVKHFQTLLIQLKFWQQKDGMLTKSLGEDGAQWVLEGVAGGQYRIVEMWSPESGDKLAEIGRFLVEDVGGWQGKDVLSY